jgi:copper chaperone CopZ
MRFPLYFTAPLSALLATTAISLVGCATSSSSDRADSAPGTTPAMGSVSELAPTERTAISGESATLWVQGMSCPKCANSINLLLKEVPGVTGTDIDMSTGEVHVRLAGMPNPSAADLAAAVKRSGFTLAKITTP